jgi:hypothetical protein
MCIDKGMVSGRRQAVDSALIKANASMDSIAEKEVMDDADAFATELSNNDEDKQKRVTACKKKKVEEHHRWKEKACHGMPTTRSEKFKEKHSGEENHYPQFLSNHTHYSTTGKDARIAVKPGKPRQLNYLAPTSVDTSHHVITCIDFLLVAVGPCSELHS